MPASDDKQTKYYTYILLTENNKLYCGYTNDVQKRFENHKAGIAAKYTRANKPVKILYCEEHETRSAAMKEEYRIKHLTRKQKEEFIEEKLKTN